MATITSSSTDPDRSSSSADSSLSEQEFHEAITIHSTHSESGSSVEDLRAPSPIPFHGLSPRSVLQRTLAYLIHGMASEDDDSLGSHSDDEVDEEDEPTERYVATSAVTDDTKHQSTVFCNICLEHCELDKSMELSACGHRFCRECFSQFLTLKITEGSVSLKCFSDDGTQSQPCGVEIAQDDVRRLVVPEVFAKYEKFRFNKQHSFARQCPYCEFSQVCAGPDSPQCVCTHCNKWFCYTHGTAHDERTTCLQYDRKQLRHDKRNRRKIKRISKRCPNCQSPVEKNGGCNHMRCASCMTDFCWLCGKALSELIFDHYDWTNIRGCAGQQMAHIHGLTTTNKCLLWTSRFVFYVIMYPIALVLTVVAAVISCGFAVCIYRSDVTFWQVFRWAFRVVAIAGYTAIEYLCVTIVTGFAASIFGIYWVFHQLYKLSKRGMAACCVWRKQTCTSTSLCCLSSFRRSKVPPHPDVTILSPSSIPVCGYQRAHSLA